MSVKNMNEIADLLKNLRFKKKMFGGVDEADVWTQINNLHKEYQAAFDVQAECNRLLLKEKEDEILKLKRRISKLKASKGA